MDCVIIMISSPLIEVFRATGVVFDKPVVGIVPYQHIERGISLPPEEEKKFGKLLSIPSYYAEQRDSLQRMSWAELDAEQLAVEERLGLKNNNMVVSYDRDFLNVSDYRTSRELQLMYLRFTEMLFAQYSPSAIILGRESYLRSLITDTGLRRGIPAFHVFMAARTMGLRLATFDPKGQQAGMEDVFNQLTAGDLAACDTETAALADRDYDAFVNRPKQPVYATPYTPSFLRSVTIALTTGLRHILAGAIRYAMHPFDRHIGALPSPLSLLARWPQKALRMYLLDYSNLTHKRPDYSMKYIYLPLHYTPEETDMYYGREYSHHEGFIVNLARRIPSDTCLYVKDNPFMLGNRPLSFYRNLNKLHNVYIVHNHTNTFELINNAQAVLTVVGTAGWEGYLLNRPVVVLGDVFYNFLPGVLYTSLCDPAFTERLVSYLREFKPDPQERRLALRACYASSLYLGQATGGQSNQSVEEQNAYAISRLALTLMNRYRAQLSQPRD
ncbi:MAG: hypothetical protein KKF77_15190 [Proteobacteria bacterium]|nr:hypothetical protein [Pseudomonadota bacterium]